MSEGEKPAQPKIDISLDVSGLFKSLSDLLGVLGDVARQTGQNSESNERQGEISSPDGTMRATYHIGVRSLNSIGHTNIPRTTRPAQPNPPPAPPPSEPAIREPLVDLFDEGHEFVIVIEVPGVAAEGVQIEIHGDIVALEAHGDYHYAREILLPAAVVAGSLNWQYRNGIVEVRIEKS